MPSVSENSVSEGLSSLQGRLDGTTAGGSDLTAERRHLTSYITAQLELLLLSEAQSLNISEEQKSIAKKLELLLSRSLAGNDGSQVSGFRLPIEHQATCVTTRIVSL